MDSNCVDGTEMASYTANFLLEDLVVEPALKLASAGGGSGDIHGVLTTTEDDEFLIFGRDDGRVERSIGGIHLELFEGVGVKDTGAFVAGRGDKVGAVAAHLHVRNVLLVALDRVDLLVCLPVPLADRAVLVATDNVLVEISPAGHNSLGSVLVDNLNDRFVGF